MNADTKPWVLVTGGAGYIGAHTCVALLEAGYPVLVFDSLVNGSTEALARASALGGGEIAFVQGDVRDRAALDALFARYPVSAVLHLAGGAAPATATCILTTASVTSKPVTPPQTVTLRPRW